MDEIIFTSPKKSGRIAMFLSGRGTNFRAIHDAVRAGTISAEIALVLSNVETAPGLATARERGLEALWLNPKAYPTREDYDTALLAEVQKRNVDLICLAGYMKIVTPLLCRAFVHRIMNIHPALLPAFPGLHVQQKAIEWGVRYSGATVHFVAEEVDMGPIILQAVVPVLQDDSEETLSARILEQEHKIYPEAVRLFFEGRIEVRGRRIFLR
jgi:phosphoribosylglycinamide formyltransferase-1